MQSVLPRTSARSNVALARSMYEGVSNNEEILIYMAAQEMYEMLVAQGCEDESEDTIKLGTKYAIKNGVQRGGGNGSVD